MAKLVKCKEHKEIFEVDDVHGDKCWIQNPETFFYLGYKWDEVETIPFEQLRDNYPVGPTIKLMTIKEIREGDKPRNIFYPKEDLQPENPYSWVRGLLTLHPKPSKQLAFDLGFNLIAPYASLPSGWVSSGGKVIYTTKTVRDNETGIIAYSTCDEPDCHKHNPYSELELVRKMKKETNLPVGTTLVGRDMGCGVKGTTSSKEEYKKQWIEVVNQMDLVLLDVYPYATSIEKGKEIEEMRRCIDEEWKDITVPILPVIQAHWISAHGMRKPNALEQVKFWVDRGFGYIVYPWRDEESGVRDAQDEWREANKYKKEM